MTPSEPHDSNDLLIIFETNMSSEKDCNASADVFFHVPQVATHPIDTVKSNLQGLSAGKYSGSLDCARQIVASSGITGLFRGLTPRISRYMRDGPQVL